MREVHPARVGIDGDVVEILTTARRPTQRNFLEQVITPRGRTRNSGSAEQYHAHAERKTSNGTTPHLSLL
jgi:hypothetical protein